MALKDKREQLLNHIKNHAQFTKDNHDLFLIHEGKIEPYVREVMEKTLSKEYFEKIDKRIVCYNILKRFADKVSKAYINEPMREISEESFDDILKKLEEDLDVNVNGSLADKWATLFKGFAWELYISNGKLCLRTLPYDRFLVYSENDIDPTKEEIFIKFLGLKKVKRDGKDTYINVYYSYTNEEFDAFTEDAQDYLTDAIIETGGVNPYGIIPFVYGNRSLIDLIPIPDTDLLPMSKMISVYLNDLSGALMFQCFSIIYTTDADLTNITMSPNALWNIKTDRQSNGQATLGTVKPEVDVDKVLNFIMQSLSFWLETKGVRVGAIGNVNTQDVQSGISKIVEEMDTFEIRKENIKWFMKDEKELWEKAFIMVNYLVKSSPLEASKNGYRLVPDGAIVKTTFDKPMPLQSFKERIEESKAELELKTTTLDIEIKKLHPDYSEEDVQYVLNSNNVEYSDEAGADNGQATEGNYQNT